MNPTEKLSSAEIAKTKGTEKFKVRKIEIRWSVKPGSYFLWIGSELIWCHRAVCRCDCFAGDEHSSTVANYSLLKQFVSHSLDKALLILI